jgi:DNA-binding response OmpR family regulator
MKNIRSSDTKKILVIDDDPSIVEVIKLILEDEQFEVATIPNDQSIKEFLSTIKPDLVLLDVWIGGQDGREIVQFIRSEPHLIGVPIIMVSAKNDLRTVAESVHADDYLAKPFDIKELCSKINALLQHSR